MSILGIVGSPRRNGLTAKTVEKVLEGVAKARLKTEKIYLQDFHIQPCRDCHPTLICHENDRCHHKDDFPSISKKIDEACGLVLGSAVYYGDVTRSVDNLMNIKLRHRKERPREGIPGIGVAVAGGSGNGYASTLKQIYHFFRIIGVNGLKPIPVTRFNLISVLDEAYQAGVSMSSMIAKDEYPTGPLRTAKFLDLPVIGFSYLEERFCLIAQIIEGAKSEQPKASMEKISALYAKAERFRTKGDKAKAFEALNEAYKLGTAIWNPERM